MKIFFISLGCDKNLVDSEKMIALLRDRGYEFTDDENDADVAVINSCCFVKDAKQESIDAILEVSELKKEGKLKCIVVAGCLAQRYADEIHEEIPEVDAIVGTTAFDKITEAVDEVLKGKKIDIREDIDRLANPEAERSITTEGDYEYLKIAEGCNKRCTYCIIPYVRGSFRSVPMESLLKDARELADKGVKELILVAQETTLYGVDIYGKKMLPELLHRLCEIEGFRWIRILYCYPEEITPELIQVMKEEPKICHYLDLPIQHASDHVLKSMGRRTSHDDLVRIIKTLREEIPDIALRTTLISGFPGETEEDHKELLKFVEEMRFDRLGDFTYSPEEGTPAEKFSDQVEEEVKERRRNEIMELQQGIAFENAENEIGKTMDIIIEGRIPEDHVYIGRSYRDCPGVDGYVFVRDENIRGELMTGDFIKVEITGSNEYDLIGEPISD